METIGNRIKSLRQEKGLGQVELAKCIGVGKSIVSVWERDECEPTASKIIALAKFFAISSDYLLGLED